MWHRQTIIIFLILFGMSLTLYSCNYKQQAPATSITTSATPSPEHNSETLPETPTPSSIPTRTAIYEPTHTPSPELLRFSPTPSEEATPEMTGIPDAEPTQGLTDTPTPTAEPALTDAPKPTVTPVSKPTATPAPTETTKPTATGVPKVTSSPTPTEIPWPSVMPFDPPGEGYFDTNGVWHERPADRPPVNTLRRREDIEKLLWDKINSYRTKNGVSPFESPYLFNVDPIMASYGITSLGDQMYADTIPIAKRNCQIISAEHGFSQMGATSYRAGYYTAQEAAERLLEIWQGSHQHNQNLLAVYGEGLADVAVLVVYEYIDESDVSCYAAVQMDLGVEEQYRK